MSTRTELGPEEAAELEVIRARLTQARGPAFWRELEAVAEEPALRGLLEREFPALFARTGPGLERRDFLRLMGASLGVMGIAACTRQPDEKILPFARSPEYQIPGKPLYFATAFPLHGSALGVLAESHMGRPTKLEGNPDHPSSLGATDALAQAAILGLYDPDRSHSCQRAGQISTWNSFTSELAGRLDGVSGHRGEGLAVLHAGENSPFLTEQLTRLATRFPQLRTYRWTPLHRDHARAGAELAFGRDVAVRYLVGGTRVIVALDSDFLFSGPGAVRYARDFARGRQGRSFSGRMNRLYAVESGLSVTGSMADERLALRPSQLEGFARGLANALGVVNAGAPPLDARVERFLRAAAQDLAANRGAGLVVAGAGADPIVHALSHLINRELGNVGSTLEFTLPLEPLLESNSASIRQLVEDAKNHRLDTLVILGGNPAYDAPAELDFAAALREVPFRVHLSPTVDETSELCHWHVPETHFLEQWSDARAHDGTVSIVQPLIAPLYEAGGARSAHELVALMAGEGTKSAYELLRAFWQTGSGKDAAEFEAFWRASLHDGFIAGTTFPPLELTPRADLSLGEGSPAGAGLELALHGDPAVHDGRFANNGWLQELPRPLTRLVWDNAALCSPRTAQGLGVTNGDVVELVAGEKRIEAPVWIVPAHADEVFTLHLGYGRRRGGTLGTDVGCDAYALRSLEAPWRLAGVRVRKTGFRHPLATVQKHPDQEHRNLACVATFERFKSEGKLAFAGEHASPHDELRPISLYPDFAYEGNAWGLVIDLNACLGCNACMVACQAENNIPVVGKSEVANGREMHWIRIDRYFEGGGEDQAGEGVTVLHQPVPCMHCENAPCETVCPVGATVHSDEGLNEMVYNRCIGTRYCSNNCPYKVRRFNFLAYSDYSTESLKLGRNPDVTVRTRGVMEKCTYCVQRISQARIAAKKEDRPIRDGEIVSACQAVCPTQAITFGDINDPASAISRLRSEPHHYGLLAELGTRPRTTYLARLTNPNPELAQGS